MNAGNLKMLLSRIRSSRRWMAGLVAAAVSGLALLLAPSIDENDRESAALQGVATPPVPATPVVTDPAWGKLSAIEQRTLQPLRATWSTLTAEEQDKWRLIVDRFQARPRHIQRRLAARIAEWARLTPQQRAHARLNFLVLAKRYNPRQRKEQWQAYQGAKPIQGHALAGNAWPRIGPPAFVQASPGATTVLLSQLYKLPSPDDIAEPNEVALDPPPIDVRGQQSLGVAAESAGSAAALERVGP